MLRKPAPVEDVRPYELLARVYDYLMRHVDYARWANYLEELFAAFGPTPRRIIEVACGTGTLALDLARRGYTVHGIDASEAMVDEAREKARQYGDGAPTFSTGDMRDLPPDSADALLCLYDSVNYCLTDGDLRAALSSFRRSVCDGALCVFDVTTEANSLRYFQNYHYREKHDGFVYRRHSRYLKEERLQLNEFLIQREDAPDAVREIHEQRIYSVADVLAALVPNEWAVLSTFNDYTFDPTDEQAERVHIILRALAT